MKLLVGHLGPPRGSAAVLGQTVTHGGPMPRARLGYVAQARHLPHWMSASECLHFARAGWDDARVAQLVRRLAVPLDGRIRDLWRGNYVRPYAEPVYAGSLPQGIDCQRCHGPGRKHAQLAKTAGATAEGLRNSIVNPSRLNSRRQLEVCMQCHLETTSFPLPNSLQRYERGPFSYQPGELK